MSEQKTKIEIGVGQKGEPPADAMVHEGGRPGEESEVGGRSGDWVNVSCPNCATLNTIHEDPATIEWNTCWCCWKPFSF